MNEQQLKEITQRLEAVEEGLGKLRSSTTIPFEVDAAFRERFGDIIGLSVSNKLANTEDQVVDEAGTGSYSVLGNPDGFLEIVIDNITYYIPYY